MSTKQTKWSELIKAGGADTFFDSFPDDAELARKLNEFYPDAGEISEEQIKRDRERFNRLPRRGDFREEKINSPTKKVILNKAKQLNVPEALAEIVDNIFDNYERNSSAPKKLEVKLIVYPPAGASEAELVVHENSGGIPSSRIIPLIQLGTSDKYIGGIGAWGEGFKMAVFALGQEVEIFSTFPGETPTAIVFPKGWLIPDDKLWSQWRVDIRGVARNPPPEGATTIHISYLHDKVLQYFGLSESSPKKAEVVCNGLAAYFGEVYSEKYHKHISEGRDIDIQIKIGSSSCKVKFIKPVEQRLMENLAFIPWLRPIKWKRVFKTPLEEEQRTAVVEMLVYAGLSATEAQSYSRSYAGQQQRPGVEMWGNGRKFSLKGRITDETVGWGFTYGGRGGTNPRSNASYRRLTIVALFSADDSRDIPWAAPVKDDYNRRSDFYAEIQAALARSIKLYKDAHALLEFALEPFSYAWTTYDQDMKLKSLFREVEATPAFIKSFSSSRFGKKLLSFKPSLTFEEIDDSISTPTVHSLFKLESTKIGDIVLAAAATKENPNQRVAFLKALFPSLEAQAKLEERMHLRPDEEFSHE
jgi:hypothetical protein